MTGLVFVIDKTVGPSSFDVVREMKRVFRGEKIGHAGSLDPFATGVLVVLLGKATKLSGALLNADKRYVATLKLGEATDSMDVTGETIETLPIPDLSEEKIRQVIDSFQGEWWQTPPMFSAKKKNGVRLYELARQKIEIVREKIPVQLYEVKFLSYETPYLKFEVHCSKGTYIRSLADELARKLGTVGHLSELRRTSCGGFGIQESLLVETLKASPDAHTASGHQNYVRLLMEERVSSVKGSENRANPAFRATGSRAYRQLPSSPNSVNTPV